MTIGDRFRRTGLNSYMYDPDGDYIWNGTSIVPEEELCTKQDCAESPICQPSGRSGALSNM